MPKLEMFYLAFSTLLVTNVAMHTALGYPAEDCDSTSLADAVPVSGRTLLQASMAKLASHQEGMGELRVSLTDKAPAVALQEALDLANEAMRSEKGLPEDQAVVLRDAIATLQGETIPMLLKEAEDDQLALSEARHALVSCSSNMELAAAEAETLQTSVDEKRSVHKTCRSSESELSTSNETAYTNYNSWRSSLSGPPYTVPTDISGVQQFLQGNLEWYRSANASFQLLATTLKNADAALSEKHEMCNTLQRDFEEYYCSWAQAADEGKTEFGQCIVEHSSDFHFVRGRVMDAAEQRESAYNASMITICLLSLLVDHTGNMTQASISNCTGFDYQTSAKFALTDTAEPQQADLDQMLQVQQRPGNETWRSAEYDEIDSQMLENTPACPSANAALVQVPSCTVKHIRYTDTWSWPGAATGQFRAFVYADGYGQPLSSGCQPENPECLMEKPADCKWGPAACSEWTWKASYCDVYTQSKPDFGDNTWSAYHPLGSAEVDACECYNALDGTWGADPCTDLGIDAQWVYNGIAGQPIMPLENYTATTHWNSNYYNGVGCKRNGWWQIDFPEPQAVSAFRWQGKTPLSSTYTPKTWIIEGSSDGSTWFTLQEQQDKFDQDSPSCLFGLSDGCLDSGWVNLTAVGEACPVSV